MATVREHCEEWARKHGITGLTANTLIEALKDENANLKELLIEYGDHEAGCCNKWDDSAPCRCGWKRELESLQLKVILGE